MKSYQELLAVHAVFPSVRVGCVAAGGGIVGLSVGADSWLLSFVSTRSFGFCIVFSKITRAAINRCFAVLRPRFKRSTKAS